MSGAPGAGTADIASRLAQALGPKYEVRSLGPQGASLRFDPGDVEPAAELRRR